MNKKGVTILELLISISVISVVILLLLKVMFSLNNINNDTSYASSDEISRTEIIKNIENNFLELKLNGINILEGNNTIITFNYENENKNLTIYKDKIEYNNETYSLNSKNASYSLCPKYEYLELDNNYYLVKINIEVLIDNKNTNKNDDIILTYIGLTNDTTSYLSSYTCKVPQSVK